uniref:Putative nucleoprotein n=1 Tax=Hubei blood fluke virus 2 TaxID=1922840 RepID=A0A1L3KPE7_9VIRU|nr:putative nucleoprotein [Hubei blood fluke virus 2]APG79258.1 putative nucleoprotein [Hubei blood fluke virus 2]APG79280.1 putative nucleoprotein [Hubei blood fluke virus 2]
MQQPENVESTDHTLEMESAFDTSADMEAPSVPWEQIERINKEIEHLKDQELIPKVFLEELAKSTDVNYHMEHADYFQETRKNVNMDGFNWVVDQARAELFTYEGLDIAWVYSHLCSKAQNVTTLKADVKDMITVFLMRGNNVNKMKTSMSVEGVKILDALVLKYNIKSSLQRNDKRKTLTLSRVSLCFPAYSLMGMVQLHHTKCPPIRPCLDRIHCALRVSSLMGYMTIGFCEHAYWLSLACSVVMGSVIGDKKDTLGDLKRYQIAAIEASKIIPSVIMLKLQEFRLNVPPTNWNVVSPTLMRMLSTAGDRRLLSDLVIDLEPILESLKPPMEWQGFIRIKISVPKPIAQASTPKPRASSSRLPKAK